MHVTWLKEKLGKDDRCAFKEKLGKARLRVYVGSALSGGSVGTALKVPRILASGAAN